MRTVIAAAAGYVAGVCCGLWVGRDQGGRLADVQWAQYLEHGAVGPGSARRPVGVS